MSFNMLVHIEGWGGTPVEPRAKMFTAVLDKYAPDVIAAQEVCSHWHKILKSNISDVYEVIQPKENLFSYNKTPLFYNKNTLSLEEYGYMPYSVGDDNGCRAVTWGLFTIKATGKKVVVTSTHLDLIRSGREEEELDIMNTQADELLSLADDLYGRYVCPVISCGDYNSKEPAQDTENPDVYSASGIYSKIASAMQDLKYTDAPVHCALDNPYEPTWDHIFAKGSLTTEDFFILSDKLYLTMSDHYAIIADISLT